jgi:hypothetical protein
MSNKPPAFQFYVKDWLLSESVVVMTAEQRRWYIQLLCHAWNGEPIATLPADDRKLRALAGAGDSWATDKQAVLECFEAEGDRLINRKLRDHYQERVTFCEGRSEAGRKGNEVRWGKDGSVIAKQSHSDDSEIANGTQTIALQPTTFSLQSSEVSESVGEETASPMGKQETSTPPAADSSPVPPTGDAAALCEIISGYSSNAVKPDWYKYSEAILKDITLDKLKPVLEWMYVESDFWGKRTFNTKNLRDHLEEGNLLRKYNAERALHRKKVTKVKTEAVAAAPGAHGNVSTEGKLQW